MRRIFPKGLTHQRGFALLLALILVTMGLLFAVVSQLSVVGQKFGHTAKTNAALSQAKEALIGYAATYRDTHPGEVFGYLPCPDTDGDGSADPTINSTPGPGNCGKAGETAVGLLPYRTLGLDALRDSTGVCLWYVVSGSYKATGLTKATPMNWDSQSMIAVQDANGNMVLVPGDINGGAAAVVIATGAPLGEALSGAQNRSTSTTTCGVVPSEVTAYIESTINATTTTTLKQGSDDTASHNNQNLAITNNDQVLAITPKDIFDNIKKRTDKGSLNGLATAITTVLEQKINSDLISGTAPTSSLPSGAVIVSGSYSGQVGDTSSITVATNPVDYTNLQTNWKNQYRYAVCNNLCGYCLTVGGLSCNGALLFGGAHTTGGPRTAQPTLLSDLFETDGPVVGDGKGALSLLNATSSVFTGATVFANGSADVGYCIAPSTSKPVTFTCDINSFTQQSTHSGSTSEATINTVARTVTLGYVTASSAGNGCIWFPTALPFHTALHAYFSFNIANKGEGFIFALADAARNSGGPVCGGTTLGRLLGYDGNTYPKIGLEIDTRNNSFNTDQLVSGEHYAFVYWGTSASTSDDNTHGAGILGSHTQPLNPILSAAPSGLSTLSGTDVHLPASTSWQILTNYYVRLDITKNYTAPTGTYTLKAYIATSFPTCSLADFQNISGNLSDSCPTLSPGIEQDAIAIDDISGEAMSSVFAGFTSGQRATATSDESVVISNFAIRSQ